MTRTGIDLETTRNYKYFDLIMAAFVTCLLCSDIIGVQKVSYIHLPFIGEYIYGAGVLFFPISYFFGDIFTEVYGYKRSRRVIWAGFAALAFASLMSYIVTALPAASTMSPEQNYSRKHDVWTDMADRPGLAAGVLGGRVCELVRASEDESGDQWPLALDQNDRFYCSR